MTGHRSEAREMSQQFRYAATVGEVQAAFPGVMAWHGEATNSWWAFVPVGEWGRLVEAISPAELRKAIVSAPSWPWPRS